MDFLKEIQILCLCFAILKSVASDRWACDRRQYVEFGQRATVSCIFPSDYQGVFWYDSAGTSANLIIRRGKQDNGNFITAGEGHSNGSYEIEPDGSLVITKVSNVHDRVFFVSLVDDDKTIYNFEVEVVTTYNGGQLHPLLSVCYTSNLCLVTPQKAKELNCTYNNVRPAVMLSWGFSASQDGVDIKTTDTSTGNFTFSSSSSCKVANSTLRPLESITCTANGAALNFQPAVSTAVVDMTQKTEQIWREIHKDEVYAEMNSRIEIQCERGETQATSLLWKLGDTSSSQILMFRSDRQMTQATSMNYTITFSDKGTLIFPNVSIQQEGLYTCVYTDGDDYYSYTYSVIVIVVPSPPAIVAYGCAWNSSECVFRISKTVSHKITCGVNGVYPQVDIDVTTANYSGAKIVSKNYNITKGGKVFNIAVEADINIQQNSECFHEVHCFTTGPGSTSFQSSRKITLIIESCHIRLTNVIIATGIVGIVVLLVVVVALVKCRKIRRSKEKSSSFDPEELVDTLIESPPFVGRPFEELVDILTDSRTSVLEKLVDSLTYWPLDTRSKTDFFEEEVISSFREVGKEIIQEMDRENKLVMGAAAAMTVAAVFLPFTKVLWLTAGALINAAQTEDDVAAKLTQDKQESKVVQLQLENLIDIQKQLVETTVFLDFAYKAIYEVHVDKCLNESHREQIAGMLTQVKMKQKSPKITLMEQISYIHSCIREILHVITKELSNENASLLGYSEWKSELDDAKLLPFQYLPESIKYLVYRKHNDMHDSFLTFAKRMYYSCPRVSHVRAKEGNVETELIDVPGDNLQKAFPRWSGAFWLLVFFYAS